jgi:hypothetical protein
MSNECGKWAPQTETSFPDDPPSPRQFGARDLEDQPDEQARIIYLVEPVEVRDLARFLHLKPFKVVADLLEMELFKTADDTVDFETAAIVARHHRCKAQRPPPGMLVL